jgi:hypothetical protein
VEQVPTGKADVVVLLADCRGAEDLRAAATRVAEGVGAIAPELQVLVLHLEAAAAGSSLNGEYPHLSLQPSPHPLGALDRIPATTRGGSDPYAALFTSAHRAQARAALMVGSPADDVTPALVRTLAQPVLDGQCDVVAPRYARHKFDGLIDSAIIYPLSRALYGKRLRGQIGLDFGFSAHVAERWSGGEPARGADSVKARPAWIIPQAVADDLSVGQANLAARLPPAAAQDVSATLARVLGSLFLDIERHAPFWQRVIRSQPVPTFGPVASTIGEDGGSPDVPPLIESFRLAYRNLQEIWGLVLPPATLLDLKRLTLLPATDFRLPDELWARIVYDFALGHRLRTINRDHLLGALTPAYLAWVASYALEIRNAPPLVVEERLERLCLAYEAQKPYLLRRWRWPDRFNP